MNIIFLILVRLPVFVSILSIPAFAADSDVRQFVEMPPEARATLRAEMLDFQTSIHSIISALGEQKFDEAADIAEKQIGVSAMGQHRKYPMNARPGMFMPDAMHSIARNMHVAGSDFAKIARKGNTTQALAALQPVTGACVACHRGYRTQ
jgi:hypothetical protein